MAKDKYAWGELPLVADERKNAEPCVRCGSKLGTEEHHWAPKHLFHEDADNWPKSYLCKPCHKQWHDIVTPDMIKIGRQK